MTRRRLRLAALAAALAAGWLATEPAAAAPDAGARAVLTATAGHTGARSHPWIAITSLSPNIATPKGKVIVSGIVANPTSVALHGLTVQLWSSGIPMPSRSAMNGYLTAQASSSLDAQVPGARLTLPGGVPAHGTQQWALTLKVTQPGMTRFGVYPLAAQLSSAGTELDVARTLLPFWPGKRAARTVKPLSVGWVWPLIDTPQRAACPSLLSNELAASVAPGGRLSTLLEAGRSADGRHAALTWAIDPALLSDVSAMKQPYRVSTRANCTGGTTEQANRPAAAWLGDVKDLAREHDFFVTPYDDVDLAALAHHGLDSELAAAFADGRLAAQKLLGRPQRTSPAMPGMMAWPTGGMADYGVLEALAAQPHVQVMIMDSKLMPPAAQVSYTPTAVATVPNRAGGLMHVLLTDHQITRILSLRRNQIPGVPGPGPAPHGFRAPIQQAAAFGKEQWFLAETAMIAAEPASTPRALVAAPPRRWDPSLSLAEALLNDSATAPWLHPATLASMVADGPAPGSPPRLAPPLRLISHGELSGSLLRQVDHQLVVQARLLDSILTTGGQGYLSTAVDAVESSAWRGDKRAQWHATHLLHHELAFVQDKLAQVRIFVSSRVTLGGQAGDVPVSVRNNLPQEVRVQVKARVAADDQVTIAPYKHLVNVPGKSQVTVRIPVQAAAAGSKTLTLWLATPEGAALPGKPTTLTVTATHFGTLAIVIISVALVVFVLSAAARAIRRGGPQDGSTSAEAEELDPMPSPPDPASDGGEPGSVGSGIVNEGRPAKEDDEHATAPGGADRR